MKRLLIKTAKLVAVVVYGVVFAEFFIRAMAPVPLLPRYVTGSEDGIRRNMPNESYWQTTPEVKVHLRTNSQGIRADKDFALQAEEGTCRIALFGDSFFMGYEAMLEDTFGARLEADLKAAGYRVEVLNFAVSGFGTAENLIALEKRGLPFGPDIVIFEWHNTDIDDDIRAQLFKFEDDKLVRDAPTFLPAIETSDFLMQFSAYRWLIGNSQLYSVIRERVAVSIKALLVKLASVKKAMPDSETETQSTATPAASKQKTQGPELSLAILKRAQEVAEDAGAFFMVADVPIRHSRVKFEPSISLLPEESLQDFTIATPIELFRQHASPDTKLYFEQGHFHLTPLGNQLLTDAVKSALLQQPVLEKCSAK